MRKNGFLENTWKEYTFVFYRIIPENIRKRFFTVKAARVAVFAIAIELVAAVLIYLLFFQN